MLRQTVEKKENMAAQHKFYLSGCSQPIKHSIRLTHIHFDEICVVKFNILNARCRQLEGVLSYYNVLFEMKKNLNSIFSIFNFI